MWFAGLAISHRVLVQSRGLGNSGNKVATDSINVDGNTFCRNICNKNIHLKKMTSNPNVSHFECCVLPDYDSESSSSFALAQMRCSSGAYKQNFTDFTNWTNLCFRNNHFIFHGIEHWRQSIWNEGRQIHIGWCVFSCGLIQYKDVVLPV